MKKVKMISMLLIIAMIAVSCKKETGPQGAQGAQGIQGPAGPAGTANVIYSGWKGFSASNWRLVTEFGQNIEIYSAVASSVTQSIMNSGAVLVYVKFINSAAPDQLPLTMPLTSGANQYLGFRLVADSIQIKFFDLADNNDPGTFTGDSTTNAYRYVIIPGGVVGNKSMIVNHKNQPSIADFRKMTYPEVCAYFNIPE